MQFTVPIRDPAESSVKLPGRDARHNRGVAIRRDFSTMAPGSFMRHSSKQFLGYGCLCAALLSVAACSPRRIPAMTVEDLMEDRVTLDGIMMKCNQNPTRFRDTADCENARVAIERLASQNDDPTLEKKRQEEFERARERLRLAQQRQRQEQEAKSKVDAYNLPVVPVTPAVAPDAPPPAAAPPGADAARGSGRPIGTASPSLAATTTP